jgi:hypothetical protein
MCGTGLDSRGGLDCPGFGIRTSKAGHESWLGGPRLGHIVAAG